MRLYYHLLSLLLLLLLLSLLLLLLLLLLLELLLLLPLLLLLLLLLSLLLLIVLLQLHLQPCKQNPKEGASTADRSMACLVYLAVDGRPCDCIHNLDCEGDAAGLQVFTQQPLRRARGDEDCAGVQVLDLQALVS